MLVGWLVKFMDFELFPCYYSKCFQLSYSFLVYSKIEVSPSNMDIVRMTGLILVRLERFREEQSRINCIRVRWSCFFSIWLSGKNMRTVFRRFGIIHVLLFWPVLFPNLFCFLFQHIN